MKIVQTVCGPFNKERYDSLVKHYNENKNSDEFNFAGQLMDTKFSKYLIEFLSPQFKD